MPFIRPAYQALLVAPLTFLSYRAAYALFLLLNVMLVGLCALLLRPNMTNLADSCSLLPVILTFAFLPVAVALMQGQDSIILLTLLVAAFSSLGGGREFTAGLLVGLGMFKLQIVIPIAVLFLAWRRSRFCLGFVASAGLVAAGSVWLAGVGPTVQFVRSLFSVGAGLESAQMKFPLRVTLMANLRGLTFGIGSAVLPGFWLQIATLVLSAAVLITTATLAPKKLPGTESFLLAVATAILVSYYLFIHDLSVMLIPVLVILDRFINVRATSDMYGWVAGMGAILVLVAPVCMFVAPEEFYGIAVLLAGLLGVLIKVVRRQAGT